MKLCQPIFGLPEKNMKTNLNAHSSPHKCAEYIYAAVACAKICAAKAHTHKKRTLFKRFA